MTADRGPRGVRTRDDTPPFAKGGGSSLCRRLSLVKDQKTALFCRAVFANQGKTVSRTERLYEESRTGCHKVSLFFTSLPSIPQEAKFLGTKKAVITISCGGIVPGGRKPVKGMCPEGFHR